MVVNENIVNLIIQKNEELAKFWSNSHGWAPPAASELLTKSKLDWQVELSKTLKFWNFEETENGQLILAWANLGALVEGSLKLMLSVYYEDYKASEDNYKKKGKVVDPDALALERLKQFYKKNGILNGEWTTYIDLVQQRRNAIHAFQDRPLGTSLEFNDCVVKYLGLLTEIDGQLPYPDATIY